MNEKDVIRVLRMQAWQRAQGELNAVLETYSPDDPRKFELISLIQALVNDIRVKVLKEY